MRKFISLLFLLCFLFSGCSDDNEYAVSNSSENEYPSDIEIAEDSIYIVNMSSKSYHKPNCPYAKNIKEENKEYSSDKEMLNEKGYKMCSYCFK